MSKYEIKTIKAPSSPLYSQAIKANGFVFLSGQIPVDPTTGKLVEGGIEQQFQQVIENIKAILAAASLSLTDLVRVEIYLKDITDFPVMNKLYLEQMSHDPKPVRHAMQVGHLPMNALIEISSIALDRF